MDRPGDEAGERTPAPPWLGPKRWLGPLLILATGVVLARWTWRAWPDPVVDFGRELYVPWRLNEGQVLFRDIAYFNGPLSPYWNALLFRLFGAGLMTLAWGNLALLACAVALVHGILARMAGRLAATVGCLLFLSMFAFAQLVGIANYNWVAPYSHEATHGLLLALAAYAALDRWRRTGWGPGPLLGGLALGACFLTKPEAFLAGAAAGAVLVTDAWRGGQRRLGPLALGAAAPPLLALGLLAFALPFAEALRGVLGAWPSVLAGEVSQLDFYRVGMGLDDPGARLGELLAATVPWLAALALPAVAALAVPGAPSTRRRVGLALAAGAGCALLTWVLRAGVDWPRIARPLPLFVIAVALAAAPRAWRADRETDGGAGGTAVAALAFAALAGTLLLKMILRAQIGHYGFTLALPALLVTAAALCGWIPAWLTARGRSGALFAGGAAGLLLAAAGVHLTVTGRYLDLKTETVGEGADAFRADVRGRFVSEAVGAVTNTPDGRAVASMAVLPEGILFNYLARIPNPTPYINFMPPELILFGEQAWLEAFGAAPPEVVFLVHKDTSEYGFRFFGTDYAAGLGSWVQEHYTTVGLLGQEPLRPGTGFGVRMFARGTRP